MSVIPFVCNIESCASISASMFSFRAMSVRTRSAGLVGDGRVYPMSCNKTWRPSLKNKVRGSAYVKDRKLECGERDRGRTSDASRRIRNSTRFEWVVWLC